MAQKDLRTYHRRSTTRVSGYHTCDETTGGECLIIRSKRYICNDNSVTFTFARSSANVVELFNQGISIIAFGGYVFSEKKASITLHLSYIYEQKKYNFISEKIIEANTWSAIGIHAEQRVYEKPYFSDLKVTMTLNSTINNIWDFISFDFDTISKEEFLDDSCALAFHQKTALHIPYLYYLRTDLPIEKYLCSSHLFLEGRLIALKSCNRCGRYLPININDELKTLSFSLHCKKRAPCKHSLFRSYIIKNISELKHSDISGLNIINGRLISYYGHQLECKACKKFFVNAPLNPQRNPQQFKEDGLRRRAIEVLVNALQSTNLIHFEFEHRTKKEFAKYIWNKFNKKCFKCGEESKPIAFKDMALDHTMPLAYLYRLDETATCLCSSHNSQKSDHFPVDYYSEEELVRLSSITGISLEKLHKREINQHVLDLLIKNIVWFYDEFLMNHEYQKVRDGIKTADKINDSLKRVIAGQVDLAEEYKTRTGHYPKSITIK